MSTVSPDHVLLFQTMKVAPWAKAAAKDVAEKINLNIDRYKKVAGGLGRGDEPLLPWVIGILHNLESGMDFNTHLHNGDPLANKTVRIPSGRPEFWFDIPKSERTWEMSAVDAMMSAPHRSISDPETINNIGLLLDKVERFNGLGYRKKGIYSPYLWSGTSHYSRGKYVRDGVYDANAVSKQVGFAVVLDEVLGMATRSMIDEAPPTEDELKVTVVKQVVDSLIQILTECLEAIKRLAERL